jgi:hypothetical protein
MSDKAYNLVMAARCSVTVTLIVLVTTAAIIVGVVDWLR